MPSPNQGSCWLYLLRWDNEPSIGMTVDRSGSGFIVATVEEYLAAWRAGVQEGDRVRAFNLTGEFKPTVRWTDDALATVNMHPAGKAFGLQLWKDRKIDGIRKTRSAYFMYKKCDHNRRLRGVIPKAKTPFDLSRMVEDWDRQNYKADATQVEEVQQALAHVSSADERSLPAARSPSAGSDDEQLDAEFSLDVDDVDQANPPVSRLFSQVPDDAATPSVQPSVKHASPVQTHQAVDVVAPSSGGFVHAAVVNIQQIGGPSMTCNIGHGWMDILGSNRWFSDDMVSFYCRRFAQVIPFKRLRMLESQAYNTIVRAEAKDKWARGVGDAKFVCMPICQNYHWSLVIVARTATKPLVFCLDSKNSRNKVKPVAKAVAKFLSTSTAIPISVPVQPNDDDCGLHVVSHMLTFVQMLNSTPDSDIVDKLQQVPFDKILERDELRKETTDAIAEMMYERAYWGRCALTAGEWFWWPCRRISPSFALKLQPSMRSPTTHKKRSSKTKEQVPVVWFERNIDDISYVLPTELVSLSTFSIDSVQDQCPYEDDEKLLLVESYRQACL